MKRVERRKEMARQAIGELLKSKFGKEIDLESLPTEQREPIEKLLAEASGDPEPRMRKTMDGVCKILGLDWSNEKPPGHPYAANLDGQIFRQGARLAVVELEAKNDKQIRGALLDLLACPEASKVLVIGSGAQCDPAKAVPRIRKVLQLLGAIAAQTK